MSTAKVIFYSLLAVAIGFSVGFGIFAALELPNVILKKLNAPVSGIVIAAGFIAYIAGCACFCVFKYTIKS